MIFILNKILKEISEAIEKDKNNKTEKNKK